MNHQDFGQHSKTKLNANNYNYYLRMKFDRGGWIWGFGAGTDVGTGEGRLRASVGESGAGGGDEIVAETVLAVACEGEDEDAPARLQGALPARAVPAVVGQGEIASERRYRGHRPRRKRSLEKGEHFFVLTLTDDSEHCLDHGLIAPVRSALIRARSESFSSDAGAGVSAYASEGGGRGHSAAFFTVAEDRGGGGEEKKKRRKKKGYFVQFSENSLMIFQVGSTTLVLCDLCLCNKF
ncbi:uncharacterized protein LOC109724341 [Ananas comosus]|uniref:Uncharacterized protein LOC109724341 n=1 Tax=Ananas comosus TaxID=4615 RepID=A0A6P5GLQ4_ANACO|nr:uncharacterized protein LOC109724341 [Ananas comosus]